MDKQIEILGNAQHIQFNGGLKIVKRIRIVDNKEINDAKNLAKARVHYYLSIGWMEKFSRQDLESAALEGVAEAIQRFEPKKGSVQDTKFTSYAHFWIDKYIMEYITVNKTILSGSLSDHWRGDVGYAYSLDKVSDDSPNSDCSFNVMDYDANASADHIVNETEKHNVLDDLITTALSALDGLDKVVIQLSFGLDTITGESYSIPEIARELSITKHEVETRYTNAMTIMSNNLNSLHKSKERFLSVSN